jgi:hypothetical protein
MSTPSAKIQRPFPFHLTVRMKKKVRGQNHHIKYQIMFWHIAIYLAIVATNDLKSRDNYIIYCFKQSYRRPEHIEKVKDLDDSIYEKIAYFLISLMLIINHPSARFEMLRILKNI